MRSPSLLGAMLFLVFGCSVASAGPITDSISYQGQLTDVSNNPVPDGPKDLILSIWTDSVGGTMLHSEVVVVTTSKGLFSTCLGCNGGTFPDIFTGQTLFLQTQLAGQPPMAPRTRLRSAPYSLSSSSVHGEATNGAARGRGIVSVKSPTGSGSMTNSVILLDSDSDGDGVADFVVTDSVSTNGASRVMSKDSDDDGDSDGDISFSMTPTNSSVAIKQKGTGADPNRVLLMRNRATPDELSSVSSIDDDGDTVPESEISQSMTPVSSNVAIKTKGTGADPNRVVLISGYTGTDNALHRCEIDDDGDGVPEQAISSAITPTKSQHAVNTKGTGAQIGRSVSVSSGSVVDSALHEVSFDDDGDGLPEHYISERVKKDDSKVIICHSTASARNAFNVLVSADSSEMTLISEGDGLPESSYSVSLGIGVQAVKGTFTPPGRVHPITTSSSGSSATESFCRVAADSDDDGLSDADAAFIVTPTTSSVAIKEKGTGADPRRTSIVSSAGLDSATVVCDYDEDGDGVPEAKVRQSSSAAISEIVVTKNQDLSDGRIRIAVTNDSTVFDLGYYGSVSETLKLQAGSSGTANPIEHSSGAHLTSGGVWTNASDANLKENFQAVDGAQLLEKIEDLPISQWNYKSESDEVTHIGPTAQDFQRVFGVGSDGKSISTIDPSGIALAAIKELNNKLNTQNQILSRENKQLRKEMHDLKRLVQKLASDK